MTEAKDDADAKDAPLVPVSEETWQRIGELAAGLVAAAERRRKERESQE